MLRSLNDLRHYGINATDGDLGWVHDFFFDDCDWVIRYLVIDTGTWLPRQRVLITWGSVVRADPAIRRLLVNLTREQVRHCPDIDTEKPVSRQMELKVSEYFALPPWWAAGGILGPPGVPVPPAELVGRPTATATAEAPSKEPQLRSVMKVTGYRIEAIDGPVGHIEDFICDEETWTIRYLVVDTRNWLPGRKVLISPQWVQRLSWEEGKAYVDRDRDAIRNSPAYDPTTAVNREYEVRLYGYYGRPRYWWLDPSERYGCGPSHGAVVAFENAVQCERCMR